MTAQTKKLLLVFPPLTVPTSPPLGVRYGWLLFDARPACFSAYSVPRWKRATIISNCKVSELI